MSYIVTQGGLEKLEKELEHRQVTIRQNIAQSIKEAKEQGDLSENAEYAEAKREQTENESRIIKLETMIKDADVVSHDDQIKGAQVGSQVSIICNGIKQNYKIVGSNETDPAQGRISMSSPIGKALMGRNTGDSITIKTPTGLLECTIKEIS